MKSPYINYRSFNDKALALAMFEKLKAEHITVEWENGESILDPVFGNRDFTDLYYIKLKPEDFSKADDVLMTSVAEHYEEPVSNYYLYSFTEDELKEVLNKTDEWNEYDQFWARELLRKKGIEIKEETITEGRKDHLTELRKPYKLGIAWIFCMVSLLIYSTYVFHLVLVAGIAFVASYIAFSKRVIPTGERVYAFEDSGRRACLVILGAAVLSLIYISLVLFRFIDFDRHL